MRVDLSQSLSGGSLSGSRPNRKNRSCIVYLLVLLTSRCYVCETESAPRPAAAPAAPAGPRQISMASAFEPPAGRSFSSHHHVHNRAQPPQPMALHYLSAHPALSGRDLAYLSASPCTDPRTHLHVHAHVRARADRQRATAINLGHLGRATALQRQTPLLAWPSDTTAGAVPQCASCHSHRCTQRAVFLPQRVVSLALARAVALPLVRLSATRRQPPCSPPCLHAARGFLAALAARRFLAASASARIAASVSSQSRHGSVTDMP